jgi:hypothetical protein
LPAAFAQKSCELLVALPVHSGLPREDIMRRPLATLLHISDLHIGSIDPTTGDAAISPAVQLGLDNFPLFDGLLGHRARALHDLAEFVEGLRTSDEQFQILVTGDLSRNGDAHELALARRYFESEIDLSPPNGRYVGLYTGGNTLTIPGNHDHWAGRSLPIGATPSNYFHYFIRSLPAIRSIPLGSKGHVPSCPHLDQFWMAMTASTKRELDRFLLQHGIRVILCGHTHEASMRRHYAGSRECWECGAGSATQFDIVPLKWQRRLRRQANAILNPNSLMLHRIFDVDGRLEWLATTYVRTRTRGFRATYPPRQFALL